MEVKKRGKNNSGVPFAGLLMCQYFLLKLLSNFWLNTEVYVVKYNSHCRKTAEM